MTAPRLRVPAVGWRRLLFASLVGSTTIAGVGLMYGIVRAAGTSLLELIILSLFAITFGWITISFWNAVIGFPIVLLGRDPLSLEPVPEADRLEVPPVGRTALVMPVHNESPERVMAGLEATVASLVETGRADAFELHLLSDTGDARIAAAEADAWSRLCARWEGRIRMHYRRRQVNRGRKAGNIGEFCRRSGSAYDYLVVLDADSVMEGRTLVALAALMDANPDAGIVQTLPVPAGQSTRFGRLLQFAASLHSPVLAAGQAFWQGRSGNYWGHNAILRMDPFLEHCELPVLEGRPPLGGEVISHDFVEGALMRRAGLGVYSVPWLGGSYEEVPPTIPDYATRDRRWAQGSLQHLRLLRLPGLHRLSRLHFVFGALGYVSSVLWLAMLVASTLYVMLDSVGLEAWIVHSSSGPASAGVPWAGLGAVVPLLGATAVILFGPKALALIAALVQRREEFGGGVRLLVSTLLEAAFAILVAPIMMMFHVRAVGSVLLGRAVSWKPQRRDGVELGWREAWRSGGWITATGALWAALTASFSPIFCLWLSPILVGLILAVPIVRWSALRSGPWLVRGPALFRVSTEVAVRESS